MSEKISLDSSDSAYEETVFQGFIGSNALNCMIIAYNYHCYDFA